MALPDSGHSGERLLSGSATGRCRPFADLPVFRKQPLIGCQVNHVPPGTPSPLHGANVLQTFTVAANSSLTINHDNHLRYAIIGYSGLVLKSIRRIGR